MSEPDIRTVPDHGACKKGIIVFVWREAFLGMEKSCPTVTACLGAVLIWGIGMGYTINDLVYERPTVMRR